MNNKPAPTTIPETIATALELLPERFPGSAPLNHLQFHELLAATGCGVELETATIRTVSEKDAPFGWFDERTRSQQVNALAHVALGLVDPSFPRSLSTTPEVAQARRDLMTRLAPTLLREVPGFRQLLLGLCAPRPERTQVRVIVLGPVRDEGEGPALPEVRRRTYLH